jgi:uncharacterized membrane protein YeaQ/YmgE (transglycosylase-associated protein family)
MVVVGAMAGLALGVFIHLRSPEFTLREVWQAVGGAVVIVVLSRAIVLFGVWLYRQRGTGG